METRYRVLAIFVAVLVYGLFVLWPRTPQRALPPAASPAATGSTQGVLAKRPGGVPLPSAPGPAASAATAPLPDRPDVSSPPVPVVALNRIPPQPALGSDSAPSAAPYRVRHRAAQGVTAETGEAPGWKHPSGTPLFYRPEKGFKPPEKGERNSQELRQRLREKRSNGKHTAQFLRREARVQQQRHARP